DRSFLTLVFSAGSYGSNSPVPVRSVRDRDESSCTLVCDSVRSDGVDGSALECGDCGCSGSTALLRGDARTGVYQPVVRIDVFSAEAGFYGCIEGLSALGSAARPGCAFYCPIVRHPRNLQFHVLSLVGK